jgi:hypothetical protein
VNLRILKKLSRKAAPYLPLLGDDRLQFPSEYGDNYHGVRIDDRTCWDRTRCHASYTGHGEEIVWTTRAGARIVMRPPSHPLPGTIMVGAVSGYYEPEWDEECAWLALSCRVRDEFCDWDETGPTPTRRFRNPGDIFRAAEELIAQRSLAA